MATKKATSQNEVKNNDLNFDFLNSLDVSKFTKKETLKQGAKEIYKMDSSLNEDERKAARRKLKKQRNKLVNWLLCAANDLKKSQSKENQSDFVSAAKEFNSFYLKNYIVNDYSIDSICSANSKDRKTLQIALDICKNIK